jgi:homogentisate 1,2-dioxygenase
MTEIETHLASSSVVNSATLEQAQKGGSEASPQVSMSAGAAMASMRTWTRGGFIGASSADMPVAYAPDYISVEGPHAPRRWILSDMAPADENDPSALPMLLAQSARLRLRLSGRRAPGDVIIRNVEVDELHFIQEGEVKFETDFGCIIAGPGDFVCLPRSTAYRFYATSDSGKMRDFILESTEPLKFDTPYPVGVINFGRDLERALPEAIADTGLTKLLLRAWEGDDTLFTVPSNPLAMANHIGGVIPVWKINIEKIQKLVSLPHGGPPYPFLSTDNNDVLVFNIGDRPTSGYRPPIHVNADYDEVMIYVGGESAWGGMDRPGTVGWVPKGVVHHGVAPSTPKPHASWMFETRGTLRWTEDAIGMGELMETGTYGPFNPQA